MDILKGVRTAVLREIERQPPPCCLSKAARRERRKPRSYTLRDRYDRAASLSWHYQLGVPQ